MSQTDIEITPAEKEQSVSFLTRILTGWGVPGGLARILAGAILGALSALWVLSQSGCMAEWTQSADGASSWHGRLVLPPPRVILLDK